MKFSFLFLVVMTFTLLPESAYTGHDVGIGWSQNACHIVTKIIDDVSNACMIVGLIILVLYIIYFFVQFRIKKFYLKKKFWVFTIICSILILTLIVFSKEVARYMLVGSTKPYSIEACNNKKPQTRNPGKVRAEHF